MGKRAKKEELKETQDLATLNGEEPEKKDDVLAKIDELSSKLQEKEKEAAENYDKYLRALAELENYKKRAAKEKSEAIKYGVEYLIRDILPMMDSLDRALQHAKNSEDIKAFQEGLRLVRNQLMSCLEKHGVQAIDCVNKLFDPSLHEAMFQVESDDYEDNQVVEELEKGYLLNGRLLRPAKVSVCKRIGKKECDEKIGEDFE